MIKASSIPRNQDPMNDVSLSPIHSQHREASPISGIISVQTVTKPKYGLNEPNKSNSDFISSSRISNQNEGGTIVVGQKSILEVPDEDEDEQLPKQHSELTPLTKDRLGKFDSVRAIRRYDLISDASAPTEIRNGKTAAATMLNTPVVKHVVASNFDKSIHEAVEETQKKEHQSKPKDLG